LDSSSTLFVVFVHLILNFFLWIEDKLNFLIEHIHTSWRVKSC
jgi:hypothetical protein